MAKEIERKFLVDSIEYRQLAVSSCEIAQGYICTDPDGTVRVRIKGDKAFITVKSRTVGCSRNEWEYEIPVADARQMMEICCKAVLTKTRFFVPAADGLCWEVDEFHGRHQGLVVAEIELPNEDTPFDKPAFVGREVTGDAAYYNSSLSQA